MEARLLTQWRERRDGAAFEELVRPHLRFLCGFARRLGCAAADADDVVQKTLVKLAEDGSPKPARVGLRAWLGRTLLSEVKMLFRARTRRRRHERGAPSGGGAGDLGQVDDRDAVEAALARLPEKDRRAVVLRYLHDLDYDEVAHVLKTTRLAARLRVHRAVARLRKRLGSSAPAALAALPLLGGTAEARRALAVEAARTAAAPATASLVATGVVLMTTTTKVTLAAAGVLAVSLLAWRAADRAPREARHVDRTAALHARNAPEPAAEPTAPRDAEAETPAGATLAPAAAIPKGKGGVAGRITFADGEPLRRTRVALWGNAPVTCETDDEGRYTIHGEWVAKRDIVLTGPRKYAFTIGSATMKPDALVRVDLTIERGVAIVGTLRGPQGEAPEAAQVTMRRPTAHTENVLQGGFAYQIADAEGRFRFEHLPAGEAYSLQIEAKGYEPLHHAFRTGSADVDLDLELKPARPLAVRFENLPEGAGRQFSWALTRAGTPTGHFMNGNTWMDARGEATLDAPPAGRYRLTVFRNTWWPRVERDLEIVADAMPEPVVVTVPDGGPVEGMLRDADGRPIAGVRVGAAVVRSEHTDEHGHFRLAYVVRGRHEVHVYGATSHVVLGTYDLPVRFLDLRAAGRASLRLGMPEEAGPYKGLVTLARGGTKVAEGRADEYGRIEFGYLEAGRYELTAHAMGYLTDTRWIELHRAQQLDLGRIEVSKVVTVPVRVTGAPTAMYLVAIATRRYEDSGHATAVTGIAGTITIDAHGRGTLRGLPRGRYRVTIRGEGVDTFETDLEVDPENAVPVRIELPVR